MYETIEDRVRQRAIMQRILAHWGGTAVEMPLMHPWDFEWTLGGREAIVECKARHGDYPTIYLSEAKYLKMMDQPLPALFAVELDGVTGVSNLNKAGRLHVVKGGRRDRGDPRDIERLVLVPRSSFRRLPA